MNRLVSMDMVSNALQYLSEGIDEAAAAKAERVRAEFNRKKVRAQIIRDTDGPMTIREATAECHPDYETACEREAEAVRVDELHRLNRNKADAVISAWQTESATLRAGQNFR